MFALGVSMAQTNDYKFDSVNNFYYVDWYQDDMHALTPVLPAATFDDALTFQAISGETQEDVIYYRVESEWENVFIVQRGKPVEAQYREVYLYDFTGKLCQTIIYYEY